MQKQEMQTSLETKFQALRFADENREFAMSLRQSPCLPGFKKLNDETLRALKRETVAELTAAGYTRTEAYKLADW